MQNLIKKVAIHHLERIDDTYIVTIGNSDVSVSPTVQRIVDELHKLYGRRPSKSYGKFNDNEIDYPTSANLKKYINDVNGDFSSLSASLMETLRKSAQTKVASTGGHVFFAHFERDSIQFILVAVVTDKLGAALTGASEIKDVTHLDIDGFRFAGRVNLSGWANGDERYIGFLKGKGDVAEYFKEFLGCTTTIQARVETTSMVNALKSFADQQGFTAEQREQFMGKALSICDRDARAGKPVDFAILANELHPDDPGLLSESLSDPNLSLNDGFIADRRALKGLVNFKKKTKNWSVEFDRSALHAGKVRFNAEDNTITLFDVPDDFRGELSDEYDG